jgi:excisionase family DNA binding protein
MEIDRLTYTILEAAKALGVGKGKAYEMARTGQLPVLRFGKRLVVPRYALEQMLKQAGNNKPPFDSQDL